MEAVDDMANRLTQVAETLQAIPQEKRDILQQSSFGSRDYENEPGAQTLCKLLSDLAGTTDIGRRAIA